MAVIWGVNVPVTMAALREIDPFFFDAARLTLSAGAAGGGGGRGRPEVPTSWGKVIGLGLLSSLAHRALFPSGMKATSAGNTAIIESAVGMERLGRRAWGALAVAFVGTALVSLTGVTAPNGGATLFGNLVMLAAMGTWALATVLSRPLLETSPATRQAFPGARLAPGTLGPGAPRAGPVLGGAAGLRSAHHRRLRDALHGHRVPALEPLGEGARRAPRPPATWCPWSP